MRKNIYKIFVITILIYICVVKSVYGITHLTNLNLFLRSWTQTIGENGGGTGIHTENIVKDLKNDYGYDGESLYSGMRLNTTVTVTDGPRKLINKLLKGEYTIKIGGTTKSVSKKEIKEKYGYTKSRDPKKGDTWNVLLKVNCKKESTNNGTVTNWSWTLTIDELYSGTKSEVDNAKKSIDAYWGNNLDEEEINSIGDTASDAFDAVQGAIGKLKAAKKFLEDLGKNPGGALSNAFFNFIRSFADGIQGLANKIVTIPEGIDGKITYAKSDLENDSARDNYTKVGSYKANGKSKNNLKQVTIKKNDDKDEFDFGRQKESDLTDEDKEEFPEDTPIPVIPVDIYNIATGDIQGLDINFLTGNEYHSKGAWLAVRNFGVTVIRIVMYLVAAGIITILIWNAIHIVASSLTPDARRHYVQGIQRFAISLLMLVGSIVIISLGIFASRMFLPKVTGNNTSEATSKELPIRVNIEEAKYSFSTNITGYVRYVAGIENINLHTMKAAYTTAYFFLAIANLAFVGIMWVRMVAMFVLGVMGPIIAGLYALQQEGLIRVTYRDWVSWYLGLAAVQVVFAIICRILIEVAVN